MLHLLLNLNFFAVAFVVIVAAASTAADAISIYIIFAVAVVIFSAVVDNVAAAEFLLLLLLLLLFYVFLLLPLPPLIQPCSARSLLALTRRLLRHLPRGKQVQDIVRALVVGKLCYGSILFPVRMTPTDSTCQLLQQIQTSINEMARQLLGVSRMDRTPVEELLVRSNLPILNRVVVKTILSEAWKCLHSCDGPDGGMNPLGRILSGTPSLSQRATRSADTGVLPPPLRLRDDTFVWFAFKLLNDHDSVRSARTYAAARRAAESISSAVPV